MEEAVRVVHAEPKLGQCSDFLFRQVVGFVGFVIDGTLTKL